MEILKKDECDRVYTVYMHTAPDCRRYIGITSTETHVRWQGGNGYRGNTYFTRAIKKYGWLNFTHEIIAKGLPEEEAKEIEIGLIKKYRTNERKYGFNISTGGESHKGVPCSERQKEIVRNANIGKIVSQETREKLRMTTKRMWAKKGFREHMRESNLGVKNPQYGVVRTDEEKILRGAKRVSQSDMNGNQIAVFVSLHQASEKTGVSRSSIADCCKGKYKKAGGYIWEFV